MDKRFWGILGIIAVLLVGIFALTNNHKTNSGGSKASTGTTNHVEGLGKSGVNLTEYGDYECPACGAYYPILKQIAAKYNDQIYFQFRNFPLTSIHKNAFAGARAAEAADLQGKFWQMHDALYDNQSQNSGWVVSDNPLSYFTQFAQQLGLNVDKFKTDYASATVNDRINADMNVGNTFNFDSTPSFTLDGQAITAPTPTVDAFSKIIDATIAKKTSH